MIIMEWARQRVTIDNGRITTQLPEVERLLTVATEYLRSGRFMDYFPDPDLEVEMLINEIGGKRLEYIREPQPYDPAVVY